jgi:hypothetical protein
MFVNPRDWHLQKLGYFVDGEYLFIVSSSLPCGPVRMFDERGIKCRVWGGRTWGR